MSLKNKQGKHVTLNHPSFNPIFSFLEDNNVILLGHIGEPKNCWLPLKNMTVEQDRKYFSEHPVYHMHLHPEQPSYNAHLESRDKLLERFPKLRFVGLHLSSQEWDTNKVSEFLNRFPHTMIDLAERICHIQQQAATNWKKTYDFFIRFQDRIIYGTDVIVDGSLSENQLLKYMNNRFNMHLAFFTKTKLMSAPKVSSKFLGLGLPPNVVKKIYFENASKAYKI